jgi:hypothetical protein
MLLGQGSDRPSLGGSFCELGVGRVADLLEGQSMGRQDGHVTGALPLSE